MVDYVEWPLIGREADLDHVLGLVGSGTGIAILGPAGVGKSRLLHELVDRVGGDGQAVVRTVASAATRSIPFAPFVELLPDGPTQDRLAMLASARRALEARSNQHGLLIAIDDAHQLDEMSLAFLVGAVGLEGVTVAMTARGGEPMESDLVGLWTNGVIARFDLEPLDRIRAAQLAESTLGRLASELESELWRIAQGNPLLIHELVEGARGRAIVERDDGTWALDGPIAESPRLADLVASRLRALPGDVSEALTVIALGSPLPLPLASSIVGDALGYLEERGLIAIAGPPGRPSVRPAHPMYGEILAANLADSSKRKAYLTLTRAHVGRDSAVDVLRAALWQLESGELVSPDLAMAGAEAALVRHDPGLAEILVEALESDDGRAIVTRGRALSYQQRFAEAEETLAVASVEAPLLTGELVSIRAQNLGFGLGRVTEARDMLESAVDEIEDPGMRARLNNERGMISAISGDFGDARSASQAVLSDPDSDGPSRVSAYVTLTIALAMTGDTIAMEEVVGEGLRLAEAHMATLPFARDQIEIMHMVSMMSAGQIDDALALSSNRTELDERGGAMTPTWLSARCLALDLAGRLEAAVATAHQALDHFRHHDPFGLESQARGHLALQLGQMGHEDAGRSVNGLTVPVPAPRLTVWVDRGRAWSMVALGDIEAALETAVAGGRHALAGEHSMWAAFCFHDAVRLGRPDLVIRDLRKIDVSRGATLIENFVEHAEALDEADPGSLAEVARRFGDLGTPLLAAEAWAQTAELFYDVGAEVAAARAVALSISHELRCEAPDTPALRRRPGLVTAREMEVGLDAALGLTSAQIAERHFIAGRTVDNHLSSVYRKLNVSGREQLAVVLGLSGTAPVLDNE